MKRAIEYGKTDGCTFAFVETTSFQGLTFYEKMGFEVDFTRKGYRGGVEFYYLTRRFAP